MKRIFCWLFGHIQGFTYEGLPIMEVRGRAELFEHDETTDDRFYICQRCEARRLWF